MDEKTTKLSNKTNPTVTYDTVNWEQRRYETAKDLLAGFAASQRGISIEQDVPNAIRIADELIKWLKK